MSTSIRVERQQLHYTYGEHELALSVEWSGVAKTADCPIDFEIYAGELTTWTKPAGKPITPKQRERVLDEIAAHYSKGPIADIIGPDGELLRGASTFRFSLQIPPEPSRYYEVGRFLAIPMVPTRGEREWHKKYVLDFTTVREWTSPKIPLSPADLKRIADRIVCQAKIGVTGLA